MHSRLGTPVLSYSLHTDQLQYNLPLFFIVIVLNIFIKKVITRLTEHGDVIKPLLKGAPRHVLHWAPRLIGPALQMNIHFQRFNGC